MTSYAYDGWNNLTNTAYSDGTRPMAFAYDALGRQVYAKDEGGITTTSYNAAGEVASEYTTGRLYTRTLARHRDAYGRDIGYSLNNSRKTVVEYETDTGRTRRIQNAGVWFTYYYLQGTDLKSRLQYGGSGSAYYTYEQKRDLLTQVRNYINGGIISQYDYVNDAAGRRTAITRSGSMMSETRTDAYGYNDRSELISAAKNAESAEEYAYQYDDIGNRIESLDLGTNRTYVANGLNQYTSITGSVGDPPAQTEDFTPAFDLDGNQTLIKTSTGIWQVTYNAENRPVLWECGSTNIVMKFDRMGRRVEYIETVSGVTNIHHRFVYDGYLCIQRLNGGNNNSIDLVFGWDPSEQVATRPLVLQKYGQYSMFYTHDGNKNVSELVFFQQANGIAAHYEYAPFGAVTATSKSTPVTAYDFREYNPFRFSSEYADDALGLVCYARRFYDSCAGRWLNRDPIEEEGGDNLYAFCKNDPIAIFDPLGLLTSSEALNHYKSGPDDPNDSTKRTPIRISFDEIDTSEVKVTEFPVVKRLLAERKPGKHPVTWKNKNDNLPFSTSGDQSLYLGDVSLKLEGTLEIKTDCTWTFDGILKCFDDLYDFNASTHRSPIGELLTSIGRKTKGKTFYIEIRGVKKITENGTLETTSNKWRIY